MTLTLSNSNSILYGQGLLPHTLQWQGSTYISQPYGKPLTFTQDFSSLTNWWTPALEGKTLPLAEFDQSMFIGEANGLWVYRLYLDGNLVGTYTMFNQSFMIPIQFDRVEAVAMGSFLGTPGGSLSAPNAADEPSLEVPAPGVGVMLAVAGLLLATRKRK